MPSSEMSRRSVAGPSSHEAAVIQTLRWADEAAAERDFAAALEWLVAIEAIGDQLSEVHLGKRITWELAVRGHAV